MLSPPETDLVRRDDAIPGLAAVLDPDAFVTELQRAAPDAGIRWAKINHARYKPRGYCRVSYQVGTADAEFEADVRACRVQDLSRWLKGHERAAIPESQRPGCIVLADLAVLVNLFPYDLKLPQLRCLADPVECRQMLRELLPDQAELRRGELRCLRYAPERRYVAELRGSDKSKALVKFYTRKSYIRSKGNAQAFQCRGSLRVARLLGASDRRRSLAFEWLPGRVLFELWIAKEIDRDAMTAAGIALAQLHAQETNALECRKRHHEAGELLEIADEIGALSPHLARRAGKVAHQLAALLSRAPELRVPLHGDFSPHQVILGQDAVGIIDLDWACRGDPADDLGNMIAQLEHFSLRGTLPSSRAVALKDSLLDSYGRATQRPVPKRIDLYAAASLFRKVSYPFRARETDWPARTESTLARAEALAALCAALVALLMLCLPLGPRAEILSVLLPLEGDETAGLGQDRSGGERGKFKLKKPNLDVPYALHS